MSRHRRSKSASASASASSSDDDNEEAATELLRADVLRYMQVKRSELKLDEKLGNGSYGDIHRARLFGMSVAVKAIKSGLADDDFEDFQREVQLLTSMNHPHIVQAIGAVVGDGSSDDPPLLILELCERGSLDNYVRGRPRLSCASIIQISLGIANGLNYLHHRGIIHRDIKSGNILLTKYLQAKIADFGLCHVTEGKKVRGSFGEVGTPSFMAPEVLRNEVYGTSCDVFSFGMIVCEMLCGHYPFKVASRAHVSNTNDFSEDILKGQRPDIPDDAHPELVSLINQCWQDEPDKRPKMDDVIITLESIRDSLVNARPLRHDDRNAEEWPEEATRQLTERKKQVSELTAKQRSLTKELTKERRGHAKAVKSVAELEEEVAALRRQLGLPTDARSSSSSLSSQVENDKASDVSGSGSGSDDNNSDDNDDDDEEEEDNGTDDNASDNDDNDAASDDDSSEKKQSATSDDKEKKQRYRSPRVRQLRSRAVPAGTPVASSCITTTVPITVNRRTPAPRSSRPDGKRTSPTTIDASSSSCTITSTTTTIVSGNTDRRGRTRAATAAAVIITKKDSSKNDGSDNDNDNDDTNDTSGHDDDEKENRLPLITPKARTRATRRRAGSNHDHSSKKTTECGTSPSTDRSLFALRRISPSTLSALASGKKPRRSDSPITTPTTKASINIHTNTDHHHDADHDHDDNKTPHVLSHTVRATRSRPALQPLTNLVTPSSSSRVTLNRKRTRSATPLVTSCISEEDNDDDDNDDSDNDNENDDNEVTAKRRVTRRSSRVTRTKRHRSAAA